MDYVSGMKLKDIHADDKDLFCELISNFGLKSIFFDGHVHGDLHQGNCRFIIDTDDIDAREKVVVYDFGILCKISRAEQDSMFRFCKRAFERDYVESATICLNEFVQPGHIYTSLAPEDKQVLRSLVEKWILDCISDRKVIASTDIQTLSHILYSYSLRPKEWFCKIIVSFIIHESLIRNLSVSKSFLEYGEELISGI